MDMLDSPVSEQQATLMFEVSSSLGSPIDDLLCEGPVIGMDALYHRFNCWLQCAVVLEDAIGFV